MFDCLMKNQDCIGIRLILWMKETLQIMQILSKQYIFFRRRHLIFCGHGRRQFEFLDRLEACLLLNIATCESDFSLNFASDLLVG